MSRSGKLIVVGDVVPTRALPSDWHPFGEADFVFGDLEVPLTERGLRWDKPVSYRAAPDRARELAGVGFGLVSLANNQAMNYGRTGLVDTITALDQAGVPFIGAGPDLEAALKPHITELGGKRIAFIGLTCVAPRHWDAGADRSGLAVLRPRQAAEIDPAWAAEEPGVAPTVHTWLDDDALARAAAAVQRALEHADLVVAAVHWGVGSSYQITGYQRQLGHALLNAGAALVLGSHPPPLQGFERTNAGLISYSLGTFIRQQPQEGVGLALSAAYSRMPRESAILELTVKGGRFSEAHVHPAVLDDDGIARQVSGERARRIIRTILDRSTGLIPNPAQGEEPETLTIHLDNEFATGSDRPSDGSMVPSGPEVAARQGPR
ncbi:MULTISPECIES: CapA family protein [Aminobacter]|uniref:CapA family protein n=1 Tax=Aminobacter TaxID=31988 RepID=UPI0012B08D75|nr:MULTISPECIES: CapA family protein [Aminobacter]MDR7224612.1 poly-gamma-glutamate synthesis protein (capsule biosynthesis protein) [Aminobacter aminovorans]MRX37326.1 hypothetical protein [Aminobacter sp. MDW-2]QNH33933.1 CapA family protein [Aminobacter sp. MDW-2]